MYILAIAVVAGLLPLAPIVVFALRRRRKPSVRTTRRLVFGLGGLQTIIALMILGMGLVWLFAPGVALAADEAPEAAGDPYTAFAAVISVSIGSVSAAYAVSTIGSAAIGAIAERPDVAGRALIFVGLAEGVAIYGLIIAFMVLNR